MNASTIDIDPSRVPVFINCRDRVTYLRALVEWLESTGSERIYLVDNASTYPPLLELYESTPHVVVRLPENGGHLAPWAHGVVDRYADGPYVVTDPDVLPTETCPADAVHRLGEILDRHDDVVKVGLGLVVDDVPDHFVLAPHVRAWESQHWVEETEPGVYVAPVDTTFALYRPGVPFAKRPALRTGPPYVARHLPWYVDSSALSSEERYYRARALDPVNTWNRDRLAPKLDGYFHRSLWARARRRLRSLRARATP